MTFSFSSVIVALYKSLTYLSINQSIRIIFNVAKIAIAITKSTTVTYS